MGSPPPGGRARRPRRRRGRVPSRDAVGQVRRVAGVPRRAVRAGVRPAAERGRCPVPRPGGEGRGGRRGAAHGPGRECAGRGRPTRSHRRSARHADRRRRPGSFGGRVARRARGTRGRRPATRDRTALHRDEGDRRAVAHRPRAAGTDPRRPRDRQDHHRPRRDPRPAGHRGEVRLRLHRRTEGGARGGRGRAGGPRRAGIHGGRGRDGRRPDGPPVPRPVRGLLHRRILHAPRRPRPRGVRRPDQARRRVPPRVPAARPPAGAGGVPRRRVLPARPVARTRHEIARRGSAAAASRHSPSPPRRPGTWPRTSRRT